MGKTCELESQAHIEWSEGQCILCSEHLWESAIEVLGAGVALPVCKRWSRHLPSRSIQLVVFALLKASRYALKVKVPFAVCARAVTMRVGVAMYSEALQIVCCGLLSILLEVWGVWRLRWAGASILSYYDYDYVTSQVATCYESKGR